MMNVLEQTLEALLMASDRPLSVDELLKLLRSQDADIGRDDIQRALDTLAGENANRGVELTRVASGYRYQTRREFAASISELMKEKPPRYSRALLETLALIVYRQPVTRAEIEEVRGVSVGTYMIRLLEEREWIKVVGHKEVPGRPALYATTGEFLDYFNLRGLDELPPLPDMEEIVRAHPQLQIVPDSGDSSGDSGGDSSEDKDADGHSRDDEARTDAAGAGN